jgi:hypothetical protein
MSEMVALLLFFQDMSRTTPFVLGENTKRGGWEDHKEHLTRRGIKICLLTQAVVFPRLQVLLHQGEFGVVYSDASDPLNVNNFPEGLTPRADA